MKSVRFGLIGVGAMGATHARHLRAGAIPGLELVALADPATPTLPELRGLTTFKDGAELIASGLVDAVLIATPHFSHTTLGIAALDAGLHVLVEKPISVHVADCRRLLAAHRNPQQVFAAMFNQRTLPAHVKLRELLRSGALGRITRIHWTITNWFRSNAYYASGGWRATWAGEGGGVLLNQAPHNLDLFWWLFGDTLRVRAACHFGKYHPIEVEDEVTAYLELKSGATATFVTSTGEAPGSNRLEICGDLGVIVFDGTKISFERNEVATAEFCRINKTAFDRPATQVVPVELPPASETAPHNLILANFATAVREGAPLIAPATEGIHSVELANAMLLSTWLDRTVTLPLDGEVYATELQKRIATSRRQLAVEAPAAGDFSKSFN